jgi:hypothetical protein
MQEGPPLGTGVWVVCLDYDYEASWEKKPSEGSNMTGTGSWNCIEVRRHPLLGKVKENTYPWKCCRSTTVHILLGTASPLQSGARLYKGACQRGPRI